MSGDSMVDTDRDLNRDAYLHVIKVIWEDRALAMPAQAYLKSRSVRAEAGSNTDSNDTFKKATTINELDPTWPATWIRKNPAVPLHTLEEVQGFDDQGMVQLVCYLCKLHPGLRFDSKCKQKNFMDAVLKDRYSSLQGKVRPLKVGDGGIKADGSVDWVTHGVYQLKWSTDGGRVPSVVHRGTSYEVQLNNHAVVTPDFVLTKNWSETLAEVTCGSTGRYTLKSFFAKDQGPNKEPEWMGSRCIGFNAKVAAVAQRMDEARMVLKRELSEPTKFMEKQEEEKNTLTAKRAREVLDRQRAERDCKRRISLKGQGLGRPGLSHRLRPAMSRRQGHSGAARSVPVSCA